MKQRLSIIAFVLMTAAAAAPNGQRLTRPLLGVGPPPNADALFDDSVVQEIRLVVNSTDWQLLK
jgi:hypothetical protein